MLVCLTGVLEGPAFAGSVAIRQRYPPPAVRAQVISTIMSVTLTASALGSAAGGAARKPATIVTLFGDDQPAGRRVHSLSRPEMIGSRRSRHVGQISSATTRMHAGDPYAEPLAGLA